MNMNTAHQHYFTHYGIHVFHNFILHVFDIYIHQAAR